jgi:large subunit ribosomal protein L11
MSMAKEQVVEAMVEGGKATAAPPLGPALGPTGLNIGKVIADINTKTAAFKGMQVPIKITVNPADKSYTITVGLPPVSALIKKEGNLEKGAANPSEFIANLYIEQVIKIAKMKSDNLLGKDLKAKVKEVLGSCDSMGVMVEGKRAREAVRAIDAGEFAEEIKAEKTELTAEELRKLEAEKKRLQEEVERRRAEFMAKAKAIIESMAGQARGAIKAKLIEAKIPATIIEELLPVESAAGAAGKEGGEKPAAAAGAKK